MSNNPSKPFSNGTEYEFFQYNFCERCRNMVLRDDGFPAFPERGGCPILDATENARYNIELFPNEQIRELRDKEDRIIAWHYCTKFSNADNDIMEKYFMMMKKALEKKDGEAPAVIEVKDGE